MKSTKMSTEAQRPIPTYIIQKLKRSCHSLEVVGKRTSALTNTSLPSGEIQSQESQDPGDLKFNRSDLKFNHRERVEQK